MRWLLIGFVLLSSACVSHSNTRHAHRHGHHHGLLADGHCHHHHHLDQRGSLRSILARDAVWATAHLVARAVEASERRSRAAAARRAIPRTRTRHRIAMVPDAPRRTAGPRLDAQVGRRVRIERRAAAPVEGHLRGHDGMYAFVADADGQTHRISAMEVADFEVLAAAP